MRTRDGRFHPGSRARVETRPASWLPVIGLHDMHAATRLGECLAEERAMAAWVGENLRGLLLSHLDARVSGVKDAG